MNLEFFIGLRLYLISDRDNKVDSLFITCISMQIPANTTEKYF